MSVTYPKIRAKVTRAKQNLQDFQLGLAAFYKTNPYRIRSKEDANRGQRIYYVERADAVPDDLAAIAADVLSNLRAPLDHIAYQAVVESLRGAEPEWLVYYPICATANDYPSVRTKIKGIRKDLIEAIDATEPYENGKGHALWQLNALHKPDKHQLLVGATHQIWVDIMPNFIEGIRFLGLNLTDIPPLYLRESSATGLKLGDEIYLEPIDTKMHKDRQFSCNVSFSNHRANNGEPALKTLQDITNLVSEIVDTIGPNLR